jgi:hypothetical protein
MMFERHSLKNGRVFCNRSGRYCNANVSVRIMESKTMKLTKSYKSKEKSHKKQLFKEAKKSKWEWRI